MTSSLIVIGLVVLVVGGGAVAFFMWVLQSGHFHMHTTAQDDNPTARLSTAANEPAEADDNDSEQNVA